MIEVLKALFTNLHSEVIPFCNWKGYGALEKNLMGEGDLDLFIPLEYKGKFEKVTEHCNFKKLSSYQASYPFIEHYYGFDPKTKKFAHLHVYYKIVTGEHISKNYVLPLEKYILENTTREELLPSLTYNAKQNIYLIRYFIKIGSMFGILQYLRERKKYSKEWDIIQRSSNPESIPDLNITEEISYEMKKIFESGSLLKKISYSFYLKGILRGFRRRNLMRHFLHQYKSLNKRLVNKIFIKRKKLFDPGFVIAICGLDGSGKSTLVKELKNTFSKEFSVKIFHLGRPSSNLITFFPNFLFKSLSIVRRLRVKEIKVKEAPKIRISTIHALRALCLAYDRKIESLKAHNLSRKGYLVICDRYPGLTVGKMDSPRIPYDKTRNRFYQFLYRKENSFYNTIQSANQLFHLSVPLEVALERNDKRTKFGKETETELKARFYVNEGVKFLGERYFLIDSTKSFEDVKSEVISKLWSTTT